MEQIDHKMKRNLKLEKDIYGVKGALEKLDEEFKEFIIKQPNPKEFFELYHRFFYNIDKTIHRYFLDESTAYAYPEGYENPRFGDIRDLSDQIKNLQDEIKNVERHHFYFKNGKFIMSDEYEDDPEPQLIAGGGKVFYMQSSRKRPITDYQTYLNLKMRVRKSMGDIDDKEFITFVDKQCMLGLATGPAINTLQDIYIPLSNINIYPQHPNTGSTDVPQFGIGTSNLIG